GGRPTPGAPTAPRARLPSGRRRSAIVYSCAPSYGASFAPRISKWPDPAPAQPDPSGRNGPCGGQARVVRLVWETFAALFVPLALVGAVRPRPAPRHSCRVARPVRLALVPILRLPPLAALSLPVWPSPAPPT